MAPHRACRPLQNIVVPKEPSSVSTGENSNCVAEQSTNVVERLARATANLVSIHSVNTGFAASHPVPQSSTPAKRQAAVGRTHPIAAPISSLPPSSFPSSSTCERFPDVNADAADEGSSNYASLSADDPFGFLAVERKLKVQRADAAPLHSRTGEASDSSASDDGDVEISRNDGTEEAFAYAFPTPPPARLRLGDTSFSTERDATPTAAQDRSLLVTPKRRIRKRKPAASPSSNSLNLSSLPSTPSPSKPSRNTLHSLQQKNEKDDDRLPLADKIDQPAKSKGKGRPKKAKATTNDAKEELNVMAISRELEALLPRRPVKKILPVRAKGRKADGAETENKAQKALVSKGKGKRNVKPASKRDVKDEGEIFSLDSEEAETQRNARIEYFKKLEGFEVEKENVYLV
ncbi:hypothetical protein BD410DRAFT_901073 [Rickenella mellea]|uniref:Uncharacterized protein n=1 Tax=Rickenella mellea TaxID=50990 RepID=A0A4Y7PRJ7_9AGAM|nr:hypothetical protein BD410DRAFT_901073 [Rickenella mellea]